MDKRSGTVPEIARYMSRDGHWYFVLTGLSGWLLGAVPVFHAARKLGWQRLRREGAAFAAAGAAFFVFLVFVPMGPLWWSVYLLGSAVTTVRAARLRDLAYPQHRHRTPEFRHRDECEQRYNTRKLVALNPGKAHAMHFGRPGTRPRTIPAPPDGEMVELNTESADVIAERCGIPPDTAKALVRTRERLDGFTSIQEAVTEADLRHYDEVRLREHGLIYPNVEERRSDWRSRLRRWLRWHLRHHRIG